MPGACGYSGSPNEQLPAACGYSGNANDPRTDNFNFPDFHVNEQMPGACGYSGNPNEQMPAACGYSGSPNEPRTDNFNFSGFHVNEQMPGACGYSGSPNDPRSDNFNFSEFHVDEQMPGACGFSGNASEPRTDNFNFSDFHVNEQMPAAWEYSGSPNEPRIDSCEYPASPNEPRTDNFNFSDFHFNEQMPAACGYSGNPNDPHTESWEYPDRPIEQLPGACGYSGNADGPRVDSCEYSCEYSSTQSIENFCQNYEKLISLHRETEIEFSRDVSAGISDIMEKMVASSSALEIEERSAENFPAPQPSAEEIYENLHVSLNNDDNRNFFEEKIDKYSKIYREKKSDILQEMVNFCDAVIGCAKYGDCKSCRVQVVKHANNPHVTCDEIPPEEFSPNMDFLSAVDDNTFPNTLEEDPFDDVMEERERPAQGPSPDPILLDEEISNAEVLIQNLTIQ